jgi:DNA mismatch repair protein MutL
MNRIRLLPEQVANQIAAGEVIERPASVVKELVENALDAQAQRVTVEIQAGGRSLVRVIDDGTGMSRDDALLCLERHATSKIQRAEDLAAIVTMGFRGEALPSIASVSRFTLTTRERDGGQPEGTQVIISAGKIVEVKAAGCAPGTTIEVRQLFFNLPARRKFLRTEETESAHIHHYLMLAALAYPEVAFSFVKDGRSVWQLPAVKSGRDYPVRLAAVRERLRALYGDEQKLLPVNFAADIPSFQEAQCARVALASGAGPPAPGETTRPRNVEGPPASAHASSDALNSAAQSPEFRLWGFIGAPGVSRATREDQHLFVNRRPVENRGLNFALLEGYHTSLMKGRYPVCCLFLEIEPAAVDVNIHPSKREVKFHREIEVRRLVSQAVRQTLLDFHGADTSQAPGVRSQVPEVRGESPGATAVGVPGTSGQPDTEAGQTSLPQFSVPSPASCQPQSHAAGNPAPPTSVTAAPTNATPIASPSSAAHPAAVAPFAPFTPSPVSPPSPSEPVALRPSPLPPRPSQAPVPLLNVPLRLVGVIGRLYVVLESDRGLVLLDQHAAHERILFEQMLNRLEQNDLAPSQKLLLPETVELSARDASFLREQLPALARLGVGLSEFGERTFLLDALPPFVKASEPRRFVLQLVDELKAVGQEINTLRLGEHMVAKTVCRHAVKANDPLAGRELEALVEDLRHCAMPYTCPHGRPTLIEMNFRELEKKFGRAQ